MKNIVLVSLFVAVSFLSCNNDDKNPSSCDFQTLVDSTLFANAPNDQLTINSLEINEDCLRINFSSSGCDGDSWEIKLIDSEEILESTPIQRRLRLSLKNDELCEAFITRELTFDVSHARVNGNPVKLNIINSDDQILYEY